VQGVEPCSVALEATCSPEAHSYSFNVRKICSLYTPSASQFPLLLSQLGNLVIEVSSQSWWHFH